jgi:hypothetical protein
MSRDVFKVIGRAWVLGRQLRISKLSDHPSSGYSRKPRPDGFQRDRPSYGGKPRWDRDRRNDR